MFKSTDCVPLIIFLSLREYKKIIKALLYTPMTIMRFTLIMQNLEYHVFTSFLECGREARRLPELELAEPESRV